MAKKKSRISLKIIVGVLVLLIVGFFVAYQVKKQADLSKINSFEECAKAGFPVMDSYPGRCSIPNGKSFTQEIGNELEYHDEFLIENPRPNQKISSPLKVTGKAKGFWFFEGSFSGELFDENNNSLGTVILTAKGEWMTEEFVPFEGVLDFNTQATKGTLKIKNSNPSEMPENSKELIIPVQF